MLIHQGIQTMSEGRQANRICLIYGNRRITYSELHSQADCLARRMATQIRKGSRVLVKCSDPVTQLLYFFAVIQAGGACLLVDTSTSEEFCQELIVLHNLNLYINEHHDIGTRKAPVLPDVHHYDFFLGTLSSGSTGRPKVIWRDHQSWTSAFSSQSQVFNIDDAETLFLSGSLAYSANLNACLHIFSEGGTVVFASNSMPRTWVREIADYQVSAMFMVPANYKSLIKAMHVPFVQIKSIVSAGSKMDRNTILNLLQYFPQSGIYEYYGASELGHVSYLTAEELLDHPGSVGRSFPGVAISVEDGVIWVESPYLAPQYKPKASVGDLGRLDSAGYLYLLGREQRMINTGGVKVIPEQVEKILLQCPGISEAIVGGIDDPVRGQKVCAWLVKSKTGLMSIDVIHFCRKRMLKSCCPQKIIFIDAMPLNPNGKIDRIRLQEEYSRSS